ncbi:MAG: hypothetical protein OEZ22_04505 [Spirochaetia bacterium]|nr:hypothetical protein [Spirochaetia bacterium]
MQNVLYKKKVYSYAKLNIGLEVPFRYLSGYHHIVSLFVPINYFDEIEFSLVPDNKFELEFQNVLPFKENKSLEGAFFKKNIKSNLLFKAFEFTKIISVECKKNGFIETAKILNKPFGIHVKIKKMVPSPSGLGAGSSNAASLIKFILEYIKKNIKNSFEKKNISKFIQDKALSIGADVPFFISCRPALVSGIGEIKKNKKIPYLSGILAVPRFGFSTPVMYSGLKKTLQCENYLKNVIKAEKSYNKLIKVFLAEINKIQNNNSLAYLIHDFLLEKNYGYMIKNEFFYAAKEIYSDETKILEKAMDDISMQIKNMVSKAGLQREIYMSMSGSGASFYSFFVSEKNNRVLNEILDKVCQIATKKYPEIHWKVWNTI